MAQAQHGPAAYTYGGDERAELAAAFAGAEARGAPPAYETSGLRQRRAHEKAEDEEELLERAGAPPSSSRAPAHARSSSAGAGGGEDEGMRKYNMWYTASRLSVTLHRGGPETPAEYMMQSDALALRRPNLLLRRGPRRDAPVVAFARIRLHTRHVLIGRGDCTAPGWKADGGGGGDGDAATHELHRDCNIFSRSDWRFATTAGGGELTAATTTTTTPATEFVWRKDKTRFLATVYDCVDASTGAVCARLRSGGGLNFNKGGEVDVRDGLPGALEELLLVSAQAIWVWEALNYQSLFQGYD